MTEYSSDLDLDLSLLYEIADGSNEFIVESIDMFLQQTPEGLQEISNAIQQSNWPTASAEAHKLKATLGFFGMLNSQALIQEIEMGCKSSMPNLAKINDSFSQVQALTDANTVTLLKLKEEAEAKL